MARIYETCTNKYKVVGRKEPTQKERSCGVTGVSYISKTSEQGVELSQDIARICGNQQLGDGYYNIDDRIASVADILGIDQETGEYLKMV